MLNNRQIIVAATAFALAVTLAACGSSDDNDGGTPAPAAPPTTEVPSSAGVSTAAFVAFLLSLGASDTSEPMSVGTFVPPVDVVAEPQAI